MRKIFVDVETVGLEAINCRILCIVTRIIGEDNSEQERVFQGEDEKALLEAFWEMIDPMTDILIGFNSDSFDIPFIIKRCLIARVKIKRLAKNNIIDLRKMVNSFFINYSKYEKGTLSEWAAHLGIPVETFDGSHMKELYEKGDWNAIVSHCCEDIKITKALFDRCREIDLL